MGSKLSRILDTGAIGATAAAELTGTLDYEFAALTSLSGDGKVSVIGVEGDGTAAGRGWEAALNAESGAIRRCLRERRAVLTNEDGGSELAVPVHIGREVWGAFDLRAAASDAFDADDARLVELVADHTGAALRTAELYRKLEQTHLGVAEALAAALEAKDGYTAGHARWIADLGVEVGRELGLSEAQLDDLRYGAIFHDIGKIAIPDAILNKEGALTEAEFEVIKTHPVVGEQILAPVPFLADVRKIVRHDHERWDGTGYPDGLRGAQIPIGARIVLVVDAYHAMISDRPYRLAMDKTDAMKELQRERGLPVRPGGRAGAEEASLQPLGRCFAAAALRARHHEADAAPVGVDRARLVVDQADPLGVGHQAHLVQVVVVAALAGDHPQVAGVAQPGPVAHERLLGVVHRVHGHHRAVEVARANQAAAERPPSRRRARRGRRRR